MRDFNFFLPYIEKKKNLKKKYIYTIGIVLILVMTISGIYVFLDQKEKELNKELTSMKKYLSLKEVLEKTKEIEEKKKKLDLMVKYYNSVVNLNKEINQINLIDSFFMESIASSLPQDTSFNAITINGKNVDIQGNSKTRTSVAELEHNLKNLDIFNNVHVTTIARDIEEIKEETQNELQLQENEDITIDVNPIEEDTIQQTIIMDKGYKFILKCTLKDESYDEIE